MSGKKRLSEQVKETLHRSIVEAEVFLPGDQLPNELELAKALQVSRSTLREATRLLAEDGLLEVRRGLGTFVAKRPVAVGEAEVAPETDRARYEFLLMVEPEAAYLAATRGDNVQLRQLGALGEKLMEGFFSGEDCQEDWLAFHRAIFAATHNPYFQGIPDYLGGISGYMFHAGRHWMSDHQTVLDFILARNGEGAKSAMRLHLLRALHGMKDGAA